MKINPEIFLNEFLDNMKKHDVIKARVLIGYLSELSPKIQRRVLFEISRQSSLFAVKLYGFVFDLDKDRFGTLYTALQYGLEDKLKEDPLLLYPLLIDNYIKNQSELLVYISGMKGAEVFVEPISMYVDNNNLDEKKIHEVIRAMGAIGSDSAVEFLAKYMFSKHREMRIAAYKGLKIVDTAYSRQKINDIENEIYK